MRRFLNTHHGTDTVARSLQEVEAAFNGLVEVPFLEGRAIGDLDLSTTELKVAHGLGRKPKGFIVLTQDAAQVIYESSASDATHLNLKAGGAVTADVWVF